jgi:hypothetical protein
MNISLTPHFYTQSIKILNVIKVKINNFTQAIDKDSVFLKSPLSLTDYTTLKTIAPNYPLSITTTAPSIIIDSSQNYIP